MGGLGDKHILYPDTEKIEVYIIQIEFERAISKRESPVAIMVT